MIELGFGCSMTDHASRFAGGTLRVQGTSVADLGWCFVKSWLAAGKGMRIQQGLTGWTRVLVRLGMVVKQRQRKLVVGPSGLGSGGPQGDISHNPVGRERHHLGAGALAGIRNGSLEGSPPTEAQPPGQS